MHNIIVDISGVLLRAEPQASAGSCSPVPSAIELLHDLVDAGHRLYGVARMCADTFEHLEQNYGFWPVFSGMVITGNGSAQSQAGILESLLRKFQLEAEGCVCIDATLAHVSDAAMLGIDAILFRNIDQCRRELAMALRRTPIVM